VLSRACFVVNSQTSTSVSRIPAETVAVTTRRAATGVSVALVTSWLATPAQVKTHEGATCMKTDPLDQLWLDIWAFITCWVIRSFLRAHQWFYRLSSSLFLIKSIKFWSFQLDCSNLQNLVVVFPLVSVYVIGWRKTQVCLTCVLQMWTSVWTLCGVPVRSVSTRRARTAARPASRDTGCSTGSAQVTPLTWSQHCSI